jgi:hypothetical protein
MTYEQFVAEFRTRALAALNTMRTTLQSSGVNNITVEEVDAANLRFRITATRSGRTLVCYFELTPVSIIQGEMAVVITLFCEGNGSEITHSYTVGSPLRYLSDLDALLAKLTSAEQTMGEITVKGRAFLRV